jgi:hypothetical protein
MFSLSAPSRTWPGILEVLHCILIESPEALNIIQRTHIKSIISLLYKHGRNHKVSSQASAYIRSTYTRL